MGPIDYTGAMRGVTNPADAFQQSFAGFNAIRQADLQQQTQEQQLAQAQQMRSDLAALSANPTPQAIAQMSVKYPQLSEQFKRSHDMLTAEQQQSRLNAAIPVFAAVQNGRNDIAIQTLRDRAKALTGSGQDGEAKQIEAMASLIEQSPQTAKLTMGTLLSSIMGPDKFATTFQTLGQEARASDQAPGALRKVNADAAAAESGATTAAVTAKYAEPTVLKDLELKGWNIENIKSEIGYRKEANRIAAMNAAANKESNDLKRQELRLKIQEAESKLGESARAKVADVESATSSIDNLINTVDRIKKNPALKDVVGSLEGADWYPNQLAAASTMASPYGLFSSSGDERADAVALIETLKSQAFLAMAPSLKGMGALSNAEGEKLQAGLQNLSRKQSEKQFTENLDEVQRLVLKARKNVETRYGVKAPPPDTPAVQTSPQQIEDLVNKYTKPGAR